MFDPQLLNGLPFHVRLTTFRKIHCTECNKDTHSKQENHTDDMRGVLNKRVETLEHMKNVDFST